MRRFKTFGIRASECRDKPVRGRP